MINLMKKIFLTSSSSFVNFYLFVFIFIGLLFVQPTIYKLILQYYQLNNLYVFFITFVATVLISLLFAFILNFIHLHSK